MHNDNGIISAIQNESLVVDYGTEIRVLIAVVDIAVRTRTVESDGAPGHYMVGIGIGDKIHCALIYKNKLAAAVFVPGGEIGAAGLYVQ